VGRPNFLSGDYSRRKRGIECQQYTELVHIDSESWGESFKVIGEQFEIDNYSTVSTVIERFKVRIQSDRTLARRIDPVRQALMSQEQTL